VVSTWINLLLHGSVRVEMALECAIPVILLTRTNELGIGSSRTCSAPLSHDPLAKQRPQLATVVFSSSESFWTFLQHYPINTHMKTLSTHYDRFEPFHPSTLCPHLCQIESASPTVSGIH